MILLSKTSCKYLEVAGCIIKEKGIYLGDAIEINEYKNRLLFLTSEIEDEIAKDIVERIDFYDQEDTAAGISQEERRPIILEIMSNGGSVWAGFGIIAAMNRSKTPVWTVNIGYAHSMAFHIFINGAKRFTYPESIFLLHDGSTYGGDSTLKFTDYVEFNKKHTNRLIIPMITSHTKISEKEYKKKEREEWYMFCEEAVRKGVADCVLDRNTTLNLLGTMKF